MADHWQEPKEYRDRGEAAESRALAPVHARGFAFGSRQWWQACDDAYRNAMIQALRRAAAERQAGRR